MGQDGSINDDIAIETDHIAGRTGTDAQLDLIRWQLHRRDVAFEAFGIEHGRASAKTQRVATSARGEDRCTDQHPDTRTRTRTIHGDLQEERAGQES
jgi:hypothetical protein